MKLLRIIKRIIFTVINSIKYAKISNKSTRKVLRSAKNGLHLSIDKNATLNLKEPCFINRQNCYINVRDKAILSIGENVFFNTNCHVACHELIEIGNDCLFGPNVCVFDHDHLLAENKIHHHKFKTAPVYIGNNVWIGANAIILKGSRIGNNVVIGAGAVVSGEIPENTVLIQKKENVLRKWN